MILLSACLEGAKVRYNGSYMHCHTLIEGEGLATALLRQEGIELYNEEEISLVAERLKVLENEKKD